MQPSSRLESNKYYIVICVCLWPSVFTMQWVFTILLSVVCLAIKYFSTLSHKWQSFEMKLLNMKFVEE